MLRKVGIWLIVSLSYIVEPYAQGIPAGTLASVGFIVSEFLSVLENGARLGIKLPARLMDALSKLRGETVKPLTFKIVTDSQVHQPAELQADQTSQTSQTSQEAESQGVTG